MYIKVNDAMSKRKCKLKGKTEKTRNIRNYKKLLYICNRISSDQDHKIRWNTVIENFL